MAETRDLFERYASSEGPYLDFASDARAAARYPFGRELDALFAGYCDVLNDEAAAAGEPTRIHFGLVDSPVLGAWAYACPHSQYVIAFSVGTYLRLRAFFNLLALTASFNTVPMHEPPRGLSFTDVVGIGNVRDIPKLRYVPHIFPRDPDVEASPENLEYLLRLELPYVDERHRFDATTLLDCGLGYIFWHEVAHIVCGHLDASGTEAGARFAERPASLADDDEAALTQGYELLADHYAALMLAVNAPVFNYPPAAPELEQLFAFSNNQFSLQEAPLGESFLYRAAYAILAVLASFELTWSRVDAYAAASHPHPELRYSKMDASGIRLLHTDPRNDMLPEAWSSLGDEPPSLTMTWEIGWSRAVHDLSLALNAWELPNVLYWSNRTDISAFREATDAAAARFASARERAAPYGKRRLSLDAYWDDRCLRPLWAEVAGIDLQPTAADPFEEDEAPPGNLIGVFEGEMEPILSLTEPLIGRFGAERVLALVHRDLHLSDTVSDRTLIDVREHEEQAFFRQCAVVVGKSTGPDGLAFFFAAYQALVNDWLHSLIVIGPPQLPDMLENALRVAGEERLPDLLRTGRITVLQSLAVDVVAQRFAAYERGSSL